VGAPAQPAIIRAGTAPIICIAENRRSCEPGVQLLLASLAAHSPDLEVRLFCPDASPELREWVRRYPNVGLNLHPLGGEWRNYNIKPEAVLALMDAGHDDVVWVDSDIIIAADIRPYLCCLDPDVVVATEEALVSHHDDPDALRARLWGMEVGRRLPFSLNSCVARFTPRHRVLVEDWNRLLNSDVFQAAQARPWHERPRHLMGDQEVLTALLSSAAYAHFPLRCLRRGHEIIQYFGSGGYTVGDRLRHIGGGMAAFIHSQGYKPWWPLDKASGAKGAFLNLYQRLSPYVVTARRYREALGSPSWLEPSTPLARVFTRLGADRAPLVGLPLAAVADLIRAIRWGHAGGVPQYGVSEYEQQAP
jgi:hypothetical protein